METKSAAAAEATDSIRARLDTLGVPVRVFALEAKLYLPEAYAVAAGRVLVGPVKQARIDAALAKLERKSAEQDE